MVSDGEDKRLFGLMAAAQDQQAAVEAALKRLAAQEEALKGERLKLAEGVAALQAEIAALRQATRSVGPELQRGTQEAVRTAVVNSLAGAGDAAARAAAAATRPLLDRLDGVSETAQEVEASLRQVVRWVTWRLLGQVAAVVAGCVLVGVLADISIRWWTERDLAFEQAQKAVLEAEIAGLQGTRDQMVKAGMLAKITRCDPGARPCIRINEAAGKFGADGHDDYRVVLGY